MTDQRRPVQQHAGVQAQAARLARMVGPGELRAGIAAFLADTTFAAITARDRTGQLWTSPLLGTPGFLHASGPNTLRIDTPLPSADPLHSLLTGQPAGVIVIDFTTCAGSCRWRLPAPGADQRSPHRIRQCRVDP
jgi:uncharacterized protein